MVLQLDLSKNELCGIDKRGHGTYTAEGITAIADALRVNGGLTVTNLLGNQLDAESAKMLAEVAKQKGISLCGIQRDQTTADFRKKGLGPPDVILLGSDLSQAVVTGALTALNLSSNDIGGYWDSWPEEYIYTPQGPKAIADALLVNGALTSVDLRSNQLRDEGWGAIFAAICGNKDSKIMSMDASSEKIGPAGGKLIAEALRTSVAGGLTKLSLAYNKLGEEGTKAICEALEQNTTLEELDIHGSNIGGSAGAKHVAKMVGVNGGLTSINMSGNNLTDSGRDMTGQWRADGP
jgi:hypothetical protein